MKNDQLFDSKIVLLIVCLMLIITPVKSRATAILWSEATVLLDTLTLTTSGNLSINFASGVPKGTLVSRDEVFYEDIVPTPLTGGYYPFYFWTYNQNDDYYLTAQQTWEISSTGSGNLEVGLDFLWEYDWVPGFKPDAPIGGPDNVVISLFVNNIAMAHYQLNPHFDDPVYQSLSLWQRPGRYFSESEITTLTVIAHTYASGMWLDMPPDSIPVPEPATILLFGIGMTLQLVIIRRRKLKRTSPPPLVAGQTSRFCDQK